MPRYLAIVDSKKLQNLLLSGEIYISPIELKELDSSIPFDYEYFDLIEDNWVMEELSDKIFLILGIKHERDISKGLYASACEIEFLVAINNESKKTLEDLYPGFIFEILDTNFLNKYLDFVVRREASLGAVACAILLGLVEAPEVINNNTLLELVPTIPNDLLIGLVLKAKNIPFYKATYNDRTLLSLVINYQRTLNYPKGDIGYCFDMLEIYHYAKYREDVNEPSQATPSISNNDKYEKLMQIYQNNPDISLANAIELIKKEPVLQPFYNTINNISGHMAYVLFFFTKAKDKINKQGVSWSLISNIGSELTSLEEKEGLAVRLGGYLGFRSLSKVLFESLQLPIFVSYKDNLDYKLENIAENLSENEPNLISPLILTEGENIKDTASFINKFILTSAANDHQEEIDSKTENNGKLNNIDNNDFSLKTPLTITNTTNLEISDGYNDDFDPGFGIPPIFGGDFSDFVFVSPTENNQSKKIQQAQILSFKPLNNLSKNTILQPDDTNSLYSKQAVASFGRDYRVNQILYKQKKFAQYEFASTSGIEEALQFGKNFSALNTNELRYAIKKIIDKESPIRKKLVTKRITQICKKLDIALRKPELARINQEIDFVINKSEYYTDPDNFIVHNKKPIYARDRRYIKNNDKNIAKDLKSPENVSLAEILSSYIIIKRYVNMSFANPIPEDIIKELGLSIYPSSKNYQPTINRIQKIIDDFEHPKQESNFSENNKTEYTENLLSQNSV
ncbi:MAG: hypothetical protein ACI4V7_04255 [Succinivibrionaceae bacterium]